MMKKHNNRKSGFTLIELIAVMGIIITMSLVVVNSYVGISRVTASRAGARQLYGDVMLARQHACTDAKDTFLYILSDTDYVICRRIGTVSTDPVQTSEVGGSGNYKFFDLWTDLGGYTNQFEYSQSDLDYKNRLVIYDLTEDPPDDSHVNYAVVKLIWQTRYDDGGLAWNIAYGQDPSVILEGKTAELSSKLFKAGHEYGIGVYPKRRLPEGFVFTSSGGAARFVKFTPTGISEDENGPANISIEIMEAIKSGSGKKSVVKIADSKISVEYIASE